MCDNDARHGVKKATTEEKVIHKQMRRHIMPWNSHYSSIIDENMKWEIQFGKLIHKVIDRF
jgi:hypothetical protein